MSYSGGQLKANASIWFFSMKNLDAERKKMSLIYLFPYFDCIYCKLAWNNADVTKQYLFLKQGKKVINQTVTGVICWTTEGWA